LIDFDEFHPVQEKTRPKRLDRKAREKITKGFVKKTESLRLGSDSEEQIMVLQSAGRIAGETIGLGRNVDDEITKQFIIEMGNNYLTKINDVIGEIEARQGDQLFDSDLTSALATGDRFLFQLDNTVKKIDPVIKSSIKRRVVTSQKELRKIKMALLDVAING